MKVIKKYVCSEIHDKQFSKMKFGIKNKVKATHVILKIDNERSRSKTIVNFCLKKSQLYKRYGLARNLRIGLDGDDFSKNRTTCVISYIKDVK